jgi:hypothetical protein
MTNYNTQAFWIERGEWKEYELVPHVNTMIQFASYLIKENMAHNNFRFITQEKMRYIKQWIAYLTIIAPVDVTYSNDEMNQLIATEILSGYNILHRKAYVHINMPRRPLNSRYTQRLHFCLVKAIELIRINE